MPKGPCARMSVLGLVIHSPAGDGMIVICVWMVNGLMGKKYEAFTPRCELRASASEMEVPTLYVMYWHSGKCLQRACTTFIAWDATVVLFVSGELPGQHGRLFYNLPNTTKRTTIELRNQKPQREGRWEKVPVPGGWVLQDTTTDMASATCLF